MDSLEVGDKVYYIGGISYLKGKKGIIIEKSTHMENHFKLEFTNGSLIWILPMEVEYDGDRSSNEPGRCGPVRPTV